MKVVVIILCILLVGCAGLRSELFRDKTDSLYSQAVSAYKEGRFDEAMKAYEEILSYEPTYVQVYVGMGHIAMKEGKREEAIDYYERALSLDPGLRPELQSLIYAAHLGEDRTTKGYSSYLLEERFNAKEYHKILDFFKDKDIISCEERFWAIRSYTRLKEDKEAISLIEDIEDIEGWGNLDRFLSRGHIEAIGDFEDLSRRNPESIRCQYLYGIILLNNSSSYKEVISIFEKLKEGGFKSTPLLINLADAYERNDMIVDAIRVYKELTKEDPSYNKRLEALYLYLGSKRVSEVYRRQ